MSKNEKIFVQIASYRDPQLLPTLESLVGNAKKPDNLVIAIAWQHSDEDKWDNLDKFLDDSRFKVIDINYKDSKGACWARNQIQQRYNNEKYTLQLDSHHRFVENWDEELINMHKMLVKKGYKKPLLTSYIPSFNPEIDPEERVLEPWWMTFDRFIPEGAVFFLPATIPDWETLKQPIPSRFYSAHFAFTNGEFCKEVQHDPNMYFHGEEISIAVRAYTHGYDLFHPHKVIAWHEYTRNGRTKQWDDDRFWGKKNEISHRRNRILLGMEPGCTPCMRNTLQPYGLGTVRTLEDYEKFTGIRFSDRSVQMYTLENNIAPNPTIEDVEEYNNSFVKKFKHCIDLGYEQVSEKDYEFWVVAFHDEDDNTVYRKDLTPREILNLFNDPDNYIKIWCDFFVDKVPKYWVVWPYSTSKGWCERLIGQL